MGCQDNCGRLNSWGCTIFSYAYLFGLSAGWVLDHFDKLVEEGAMKNDCYVTNPDRILRLAGLDGHVIKDKRNSPRMIELFDTGKVSKGVTSFKYGKSEHFVVVNADNYVVYNSMFYSKCVADGEIDEYIRVWVR